MTTLIIPWPDSPEWEQNLRLSGVTYRLRGRYNVVGDRWALDILTADRELIVAGIRMLRGILLTEQHLDPRLPPGDMFLIGEGQPTRTNMGNGVQLVYVEPEDGAV
jgi:hypothetical protein